MKEKTLLLYRIVCFQMPNRKAIMPDEACLRFKWFCEQIPLSPKYTLQRGSFVTIFYIIHGYLALSTKKDFNCKSQGSNGGGGGIHKAGGPVAHNVYLTREFVARPE